MHTFKQEMKSNVAQKNIDTGNTFHGFAAKE